MALLTKDVTKHCGPQTGVSSAASGHYEQSNAH